MAGARFSSSIHIADALPDPVHPRSTSRRGSGCRQGCPSSVTPISAVLMVGARFGEGNLASTTAASGSANRNRTVQPVCVVVGDDPDLPGPDRGPEPFRRRHEVFDGLPDHQLRDDDQHVGVLPAGCGAGSGPGVRCRPCRSPAVRARTPPSTSARSVERTAGCGVARPDAPRGAGRSRASTWPTTPAPRPATTSAVRSSQV